jgi:hypothetical protein
MGVWQARCVSKRQLGDFADDPDSVFVDVPANPAWISILDLLLSCGAVVAAFLVAEHLGAGKLIAGIVAMLAACLVGFKVSLFAKFRRIPRLGLDEFDAVRQAGSRALAEFRRAHPDLSRVGWTLVASIAEGWAIAVRGNRGGRIVEASHVYVVSRVDTIVREVSASSYPQSSWAQRLDRADCVTR